MTHRKNSANIKLNWWFDFLCLEILQDALKLLGYLCNTVVCIIPFKFNSSISSLTSLSLDCKLLLAALIILILVSLPLVVKVVILHTVGFDIVDLI